MKLIFFILLSSFSLSASAYNSLGVECSANGSLPVLISCGSEWTQMKNEPEVFAKLQSCNKSRSERQKINLSVEQDFRSYELKFPFEKLVNGYFIFCAEF